MPDEFPDQDRGARAVFEVRLQPGENLIWAGRADPKRLASHYFWRPLLFGGIAFGVVFVFFLVSATGGFASVNIGLVSAILVMALFAGLVVFLWEALARGAWHWQDINAHYYGLTDRRLLRSIGGGRPRAFMYDKIAGLSVEGPKDDDALGDIQFYQDTGMTHQTYFRFYGVRRARRVAAVIRAHLPTGK